MCSEPLTAQTDPKSAPFLLHKWWAHRASPYVLRSQGGSNSGSVAGTQIRNISDTNWVIQYQKVHHRPYYESFYIEW